MNHLPPRKNDTNDQQLNLILRPTLRIKFQGFTNASSSWKYRRKKQQRQQIVRVHPWCRCRVNSHQLERLKVVGQRFGAPLYIQNITLTITLPVFLTSLCGKLCAGNKNQKSDSFRGNKYLYLVMFNSMS